MDRHFSHHSVLQIGKIYIWA